MSGTNPRVREEAEGENGKPSLPVIGIGASAGGIDALRGFIPAIPPGCGLAFVIVQHLDPEHGSVLSSLHRG
jgi:two-component system, chemotaxis family, CheB/CheR fusion protein